MEFHSSAKATADGLPCGIETEMRQTMRNVSTVLQANGPSFGDVFKCAAMLADMSDWPAFDSVYVTYSRSDRLPAPSAFGVSTLALHELECLAWTGKRA